MGQRTNKNTRFGGFRDFGTVEKGLWDYAHEKHLVRAKPTKCAGAHTVRVRGDAWYCTAWLNRRIIHWQSCTASVSLNSLQLREPRQPLWIRLISFYPFSSIERGGGTQEWLEVHTKIYSTILVLQVLINEETRSRRATIFKIQGFTFNV